jgi:hypothetical protein
MARTFAAASSQFVKSGSLSSLITIDAAWTVGFWYKPSAATTWGGLLKIQSDGAGTDARGFHLYQTNAGALYWTSSIGANIVGSMSAGTWYRVGLSHAGSGSANTKISLDSTTLLNADRTTESELSSGDIAGWMRNSTGDGVSFGNGDVAWLFWLQGVQLSVANIGTYLDDPCALVGAYGPGGTIVADALKFLLPLGTDHDTDLSGNSVTVTLSGSPGNADMPTGVDDGTCASGIPAAVLAAIQEYEG